jgi:hypothetical protein
MILIQQPEPSGSDAGDSQVRNRVQETLQTKHNVRERAESLNTLSIFIHKLVNNENSDLSLNLVISASCRFEINFIIIST